MNRKIPDKILEIVGNQSSYSNNVGMSDSEVLIYPDYVLKIQAESEETKNEKDIVAWLDGQVPVPSIPVLNDLPKMVHRSTKLYPLPANQRALLL